MNRFLFFLYLGTASVARGLSSYIDKLADNVMQNTMREIMPINVDFLSDYPDFLSFGVIIVLAGKFQVAKSWPQGLLP